MLEVTSQDSIKHYLRAHLLPAFGQRTLTSIRPTDIQKWVSAWAAARTHAPATIIKAHSNLHKIFGWAVRDGILAANPCASTDLPTLPETTVKIMTPIEFDLFFEQLRGTRERAMVLLAIETGMRWSEGIAAGSVDTG